MGTHRSYREHKFAFGNQLLTFRTRASLTQSALAEQVGVHLRSVQNWEAGESYPKAETLQRLIGVFLSHHAFTQGNEREEALAFWSLVAEDGPHALTSFDDRWFERTLALHTRAPVPANRELEQALDSALAPAATPDMPRAIIDWGEAIAVPTLYGRDAEMATLYQWVVEERCRVVAIVGLGGIGKSSLAIIIAHQVLSQFEVVLFRSLQNGPPLAELLDQIIRAVSDQQATPPDRESDKIALLIQLFRQRRCLLILDNVESIMQPGVFTGTYRTGYAEYGALLRALSERAHQSCLVLTSREKPSELVPLEGRTGPVRALHLSELSDSACLLLLEAKDIVATPADVSALARLYGGNPLALQLVAEPIRELFGGDVSAFLAAGDAFVGGVGKLLSEQFARSTPLEQAIVYWLAIERELLPLSALLANLGEAVPQRDVLAALESLRRRMLIERAADQPTFTLQPVILEYLTDQLVEAVRQEIVDGQPKLLHSHALIQATAKEYVRRSQERLIATSLLERLAFSSGGADTVDRQLLTQLASWRDQPLGEQGYGPGNIINLLRLLRGNLSGLDLSRLLMRQAYLQGVDVQGTNLAAATIQDCRFTENFDAINGIAISSTEQYWAAASRRGEIRVWQAGGQVLYHVWQAHTERVWALAFSPDERALASGSWDSTVKLWDVVSGSLRWSARHTGNINSVAFAPDGTLLASGGAHDVIIWDVQRGTQLQTLPHPDLVITVDWSPDGHLVATGDVAGRIRFWQINDTEPAVCLQTLEGHTQLISELAFAPDGTMLASASYDSTVKVWEVASGQVQESLTGHTERVHRVAWSPDGRLLASAGYETQIWLWDLERRSYRAALQGHTDSLTDIAFTPDSTRLLSSGDTTVRVWDVASGRCMHVLQGSAAALFDVDWSPDGMHLVSADADALVTVFTVTGEAAPLVLRGHQGLVFGVAWSPDGTRLASSSWDTTIRLWDPSAGVAVQVLRLRDEPITFFCGVAWSPDGERLASATYLNLQGVLVWDVKSGASYWARHTDATPIRRVSWSPDGTRLAGGGDNGQVYLWNSADGRLLRQFVGHRGTVKDVAWSGDGSRLVSAGGSVEGGELFVWDVQRGEPVHRFVGQAAIIYAAAWGPSDNLVVSGGSDGKLRWWDLARGTCVLVREAHQGAVQSLRRNPDRTKAASCGDDGAIRVWELRSGEYLQTLRRDRPYERLNITGIRGLTEAQKTSLIALGAVERQGDQPPVTGNTPQSIADASHLPDSGPQTQGDESLAGGLPFQPTAFIGRAAELTQITKLLGDPACRLLTLLGPGGIGKTRLALAALLARADTAVDAAGLVARLNATQAAAWLASNQHDFAHATQLFEQSISLQRSLGESASETQLLFNAAFQARALGQYRQAIRLLEEAVRRHRARGDRGSLSAGGLGLALYELGLLFREQGEFSHAARLFEECVDLHRALGDREGMAQALLALGDIARDQGNVAQMRRYAEQSLLVFREFGVQWAIGFALNNLALATYLEGDVAHAFSLIEQGVKLFRSLQADGSLAEVLITLGQIVRAQGDRVAAHTAFTEALRLAWAVGPRLLVAAALEGLAVLAIQAQRAELAVQLLAAASALRVQMGTPIRPVDQAAVEQALATARSTLGEDAFAAVWAEAKALPLDQLLNTIPSAAALSISAAPLDTLPSSTTKRSPAA